MTPPGRPNQLLACVDERGVGRYNYTPASASPLRSLQSLPSSWVHVSQQKSASFLASLHSEERCFALAVLPMCLSLVHLLSTLNSAMSSAVTSHHYICLHGGNSAFISLHLFWHFTGVSGNICVQLPMSGGSQNSVHCVSQTRSSAGRVGAGGLSFPA